MEDQKIKSNFGIVINELFLASLVLYLILLFLDVSSPGFVSSVFNLNILLIVVLVSGLIKISPLSLKRDPDQWDLIDLTFSKIRFRLKPVGVSENEFYYVIFLSSVGTFVTYIKTSKFGFISFVLCAVVFALICILSFIVITKPDEHE